MIRTVVSYAKFLRQHNYDSQVKIEGLVTVINKVNRVDLLIMKNEMCRIYNELLLDDNYTESLVCPLIQELHIIIEQLHESIGAHCFHEENLYIWEINNGYFVNDLLVKQAYLIKSAYEALCVLVENIADMLYFMEIHVNILTAVRVTPSYLHNVFKLMHWGIVYMEKVADLFVAFIWYNHHIHCPNCAYCECKEIFPFINLKTNTINKILSSQNKPESIQKVQRVIRNLNISL